MRRQSWQHVVCANSRATGNARYVLTVLSMHANRNGYVGIPRSMISLLCNISENAVRSALKRLIKMGELYPFWKREGRGNHNVYQITVLPMKVVETKKYRVNVVPVPPPVEYYPFRVMEDVK